MRSRPRGSTRWSVLALEPDPAFLKIMQSLAVSEPTSRMPTLRAEAARRGRKTWTCPALDEPWPVPEEKCS